jgi:hypothetical protein
MLPPHHIAGGNSTGPMAPCSTCLRRAGYKRAWDSVANLLFCSFLCRKNRASRRSPSPPVSRQLNPPLVDSFLPENLHNLTVLLPRLLQLKMHSSDLYTRSHHHLPPLTGESLSPCASPPATTSKGCLTFLRCSCS